MEIIGNKKNDDFFECKKCDYVCKKSSDFKKHLGTLKHIGSILEVAEVARVTKGTEVAKVSELVEVAEVLELAEVAEVAVEIAEVAAEIAEIAEIAEVAEVAELSKVVNIHTCNICNKKYQTSSGLWKHSKICNVHITETGSILEVAEVAELSKVVNIHTCNICNKKYQTSAGLWKHTKICNVNITETIKKNLFQPLSNELKTLTNLVIEIAKSNNELQKQLVDVCKNSSNTHNSHNTNYSHNKTFNLQFFLNEQCKDAMNISDFANSFDLQLSDLESVGELGYVEGITKLFVDKLNSMDIYKRPIHCSDAKREILYVKDDNKWEKEAKNNPKLRYAIKTISFRNMKLAALWSVTYPESQDGDSHLNDTYLKIIKESTGGNGDIIDNENKIIKKISKEILIDKNI